MGRAAPTPRGHHTRMSGLLALLALLTGCRDRADMPVRCDANTGESSVGVSQAALSEGSTSAIYVALLPSQMSSIVEVSSTLDDPRSISTCSGVVVAPRWVLTAAHCVRAAVHTEVFVGASPSSTADDAQVHAQHVHATLDLALLQLDVELSAVEPLRPASEARAGLDHDLVQIAGFGSQSERLFAVEQVVRSDDESFVVSASGNGGACIGDSGGPMLLRSDRGDVEVVGILSAGSSSCFGEDRYVRVDAARDWLAHLLPGPARANTSCGDIDAEGRCMGALAVWCEHDAIATRRCADDERCGFSDAAHGYRCVSDRDDACGGVDGWGHCETGDALQCMHGRRTRNACSACGATCGRSASSGEVSCFAAER